VVNSLYKAALHRRLITINPAAGVKAPTERVDPASNISYLELDELELLLGEIESQLNQAKTNKQRLPLLRDRVLVGIMSLGSCKKIKLPELEQLYIYCTTSKVTSDFIADILESWWKDNCERFAHIKTLRINQDNGPANHSRRTQFMKRMVQFADKYELNLKLAYYPPYHSKAAFL